LNINIFYESVNFRIRNWKKVKKLVSKVISEEGKFSGDLNFILARDEYVRDINKKYLNHNWFTDVISFCYNEEEGLNGEIYISIETVKRNALNYKVSYNEELLRVIVHGVLHLCGYMDKFKEEKEKMTIKENYWMEKFSEK
jgi:probable rRNA maturation factor